MEKLAETLLVRYGWRLIVGAAALIALLWLFAHYIASPGGNVSILWGLVEYTKEGAARVASRDSGGVSELTVAADPVRAPVTPEGDDTQATSPILIASDVAESDADDVIAALRKDRNLRQLAALESGRNVSNLPSGTFAFAYNPTFSFRPPYLSVALTVDRFNPYPSSRFEVQKTHNSRLWLIAFTSAPEANRLVGKMDAVVQATLLPVPWGSARSMIAIPDTVPGWSYIRKIQIDAQQELTSIEARFGKGVEESVKAELHLED